MCVVCTLGRTHWVRGLESVCGFNNHGFRASFFLHHFSSGARFRVLTVPEAATTMFSNGAALQDLDDADNKYAFQWSLMQ